jgi:hypothetical protein
MVAPSGRIFAASARAAHPIPVMQSVARSKGLSTQNTALESPKMPAPPETTVVFSRVAVVYIPGQSEGSPDARNRLGQAEQMAASLADLGRDDLKQRIKNFRGRFKLDFSDDYLDALSLDRLRHLLLAALINAKAEP